MFIPHFMLMMGSQELVQCKKLLNFNNKYKHYFPKEAFSSESVIPAIHKPSDICLLSSKSQSLLKSCQQLRSTPKRLESLQWNIPRDWFKLSIPSPTPLQTLTKCKLMSDITETFDVLGWYSLSTVKAKILMQHLWEIKIGWDDLVAHAWLQWKTELQLYTLASDH